jgi:hypothetical protein
MMLPSFLLARIAVLLEIACVVVSREAGDGVAARRVYLTI